MLSTSFNSMNPIWKKLNIPPNEFYEYLKGRIAYVSKVGYIYVMAKSTTGEFVMAASLLPLKDYASKESLDTSLGFKWGESMNEAYS